MRECKLEKTLGMGVCQLPAATEKPPARDASCLEGKRQESSKVRNDRPLINPCGVSRNDGSIWAAGSCRACRLDRTSRCSGDWVAWAAGGCWPSWRAWCKGRQGRCWTVGAPRAGGTTGEGRSEG